MKRLTWKTQFTQTCIPPIKIFKYTANEKKNSCLERQVSSFLGNFAPRTSNFCLKNRALGFPGARISLFSPGPVCRQTYDRRAWNYEERPAHEKKPPRGKDPRVKSWALKNDTKAKNGTWEF